MIRVLGIDPGIAATGWGVVECEGSRYRHIGHGVVKTSAREHVGERLKRIYDQIQEVISEFHPEIAGLESIYFARNATSAIPVAQAKGVVLLALAQAGVDSHEYPPQAIKQAILGQGRAEKKQVQEMVRVLLGLHEIPKPDHAADALATAICHATSVVVQEVVKHVQ